MRRQIITVSLLALALALPAGALAADPPTLITTPMSAEDSAGIDIIANAMLESGDVNALYVGVWDPARGAHVKAYGIADVATRARSERGGQLPDRQRDQDVHRDRHPPAGGRGQARARRDAG